MDVARMPQETDPEGRPIYSKNTPRFEPNSKRTWFVVAESSCAKVFLSQDSGRQITLINQLLHPEGRFHNREIDTDRAGSCFSSASRGTRHGLTPSEDPHTHQVSLFAHELAALLNEGRTRNEFDEIVIAAEPRFLGVLKSCLPKEFHHLAVSFITKNLSKLSERDLPVYLRETLMENRRIA